jgi:3-methyladenine DNA glycosylase AlkD
MNVDRFMGVRTPAIHRIAGTYYRTIRSQPVDRRLELCEQLLQAGLYELKIAAFRWAHLARKEFANPHLDVFSTWLDRYVDDWIDCDDLCIHVIGEFLLRYPERAIAVLDWTHSPNRWVKRGAAVSLVLPVRRGQQIDLALQVADMLLADPDDLVQKSYGWLLKEASKRYPEQVFEYVRGKRAEMPRVAFRAAIDKLPEPVRRQLMADQA